MASVSLPDLPKEKEFEEYISAFFFNQAEIILKETSLKERLKRFWNWILLPQITAHLHQRLNFLK